MPTTGYVEFGPTQAFGDAHAGRDRRRAWSTRATPARPDRRHAALLPRRHGGRQRPSSPARDARPSAPAACRSACPALTRVGDGHDGLRGDAGARRRSTAVTIINADGQIVWYHTDDRKLDFYRARLSVDGKSLLYNAAKISGEPSPASEIVRVVARRHADQLRSRFRCWRTTSSSTPDGTLAAIAFEDRDVARHAASAATSWSRSRPTGRSAPCGAAGTASIPRPRTATTRSRAGRSRTRSITTPTTTSITSACGTSAASPGSTATDARVRVGAGAVRRDAHVRARRRALPAPAPVRGARQPDPRHGQRRRARRRIARARVRARSRRQAGDAGLELHRESQRLHVRARRADPPRRRRHVRQLVGGGPDGAPRPDGHHGLEAEHGRRLRLRIPHPGRQPLRRRQPEGDDRDDAHVDSGSVHSLMGALCARLARRAATAGRRGPAGSGRQRIGNSRLGQRRRDAAAAGATAGTTGSGRRRRAAALRRARRHRDGRRRAGGRAGAAGGGRGGRGRRAGERAGAAARGRAGAAARRHGGRCRRSAGAAAARARGRRQDGHRRARAPATSTSPASPSPSTPRREHDPGRDLDAGEGRGADVWLEFTLRGQQRDDVARAGGRDRRAPRRRARRARRRRRSPCASSAGRAASTTRRATTWARPARCRPACRCRRSRSYDATLASPDRYMFGAVENSDRRLHQPLLLLPRTFWVYIMDRQGRIVWYYADAASNATTSFQRIARDGEYIWIEKRPHSGTRVGPEDDAGSPSTRRRHRARPVRRHRRHHRRQPALRREQRAARDEQGGDDPHDLELPDRVRRAASSATRTRSTGTRPTTPC